MKPKKMHRRKLIGLPLQMRYTLLLTALGGLANLLTFIVLAWFLERNYVFFTSEPLGIAPEVARAMSQEKELLSWALVLLFSFGLMVQYVLSYWITKKLIGPMIAVRRQFAAFATGNWSSEFQLRKHDEFQELKYLVNVIRKQVLQKKETA